MVKAGATMGKGALIAGLGLMVVALVLLSANSRSSPAVSLLSQGVLRRDEQFLEASAAKYTHTASQMMRAANKRKAEAENVQAIEMYLNSAQKELNAYATNVEGLVKASNKAKLPGDLARFPQESAELHALLDHSLGEADAVAVKIAQNSATSPSVPVLPQRRAFMQQQVLHATNDSPLQRVAKQLQAKTAKPLSNLQKVEATLKQLGAVKAFARQADHGDAHRVAAAALLDNVQSAAAHGTTHMLQVQPAPLLGAMRVKDGELVDPNRPMKYKPADVGLIKEDPEFEKMQTSLVPHYDPANDKLLACDTKCQKAILHSTIGVTYKVATKCVPGCEKGRYALLKLGKPLPAWQDQDELEKQDAFCNDDPVYAMCKWESLEPMCDKMSE
jgi:hypothetical protein